LLLGYIDQAAELITWLRSKTLLLALLREHQLKAGNKTKSVLRAVLTRWTSHYLAFQRLIELRDGLMAIVYEDRARSADQKRIVIGDKKTREKSEAMINVIVDSAFWIALVR
jgi:hypothetical protein